MSFALRLLLLGVLSAFSLGCGFTESNSKAKPPEFFDTVDWELEAPQSLEEIEFQDSAGQPVTLQQYLGKKNVVLVITRGYQSEGYSGSVCIYCATQTSRLMANYAAFRDRNTEVLVVFPVVKEPQKRGRDALLTAAQKQLPKPLEQPPFPVWIDLELKAVRHLGIEASLAKPATYVIDTAGRVRFAYVGQKITDRPSVKAMLAKLDEINREKQ